VEEVYFAASAKEHERANIIGTFARPSIANIVDQTLHRIGRFRDDVTWKLFDRPPSPDDLAGVDVWVDPAIREGDLDGFVAEAIVSGKSVAASRTEVNAQRLEQGRTGFLVPPDDPNELTHAILAALFKPEVARSKIEAARQTAGKFRPRQRVRVLERIYETVIR
jgi:glycosyltransferase involved in cell wall biosynthesis